MHETKMCIRRLIGYLLNLTAIVSYGYAETCVPLNLGFLPNLDTNSTYWFDQLMNLPQKTRQSKFGIWALDSYLYPWGADARSNRIKNTCYTLYVHHLSFPAAQNDREWIYDPNVLKELAKADILIGEYRRSIHNFARDRSVPYILSTPTDMPTEKRIRSETKDERIVFSAWPSWSNFFHESITALLRVRSERRGFYPDFLGRALIIQMMPKTRIGVADELLRQLVMNSTTSFTKLLKIRPDTEHFKIAAEIVRNRPDIMVFMYENKDDVSYLYGVMDKMRDILPDKSRKHMETYLWDMAYTVSGKPHSLLSYKGWVLSQYLPIRTISTRIRRPFALQCDDIEDDLTAAIGGYDAAFMALNNVLDWIPSAEYNKSRLLDQLRTTHNLLSWSRKPKTYEPTLNIAVGDSGLTFKDGFRYYASSYIGRIFPVPVGERNEGDDPAVMKYEKCDSQFEILRLAFNNMTSGAVAYWEFFSLPDIDDDKNLARAGLLKEMNKIVVVVEEPFASIRRARSKREPMTDRFEGLTIDLVKAGFERMNRRKGKVFKYEFYGEENNHYGAYDEVTKKWSGAMKHIQNKSAVMAAGMISKTKKRSRFFDFTAPFEYVGITFIGKKATAPSTLFNFMRPFELNVWYAILASMVLAAIFIHILEYWNPFYEKIDDDHRFTWKEVFWYSFGTITGAGGSFAPVIFPTRLFSVTFWFFSLILTACYTGNLASFLTELNLINLELTIEGLALTRGMKWLTISESYMDTHIRSINQNTYRRVASEMNYVEKYSEGVQAVEDGDFGTVFIGNNLLLQHYAAIHQSCGMSVSPHVEAFTELSFPMRKDWVLKDLFSEVVLEMRDDGTMQRIINRWIDYRPCTGGDEDDHTKLDFLSFRGLYVILATFTIASFVVLAIKLVALKMRELNEKKNEKQPRKSSNEIESPMMSVGEEETNNPDEIDEKELRVLEQI